jgi:hypothetical protein
MAMFRSFKKKMRFSIADRPSYRDSWQWLAIARHYDLPTRLLDWSESAGVSLYFAVRKKQDGIDSVLWCSEKPEAVKTETNDPFSIRNILLYEPEHIAARIAVQKSVFTVHPEDYKDKYLKWPCSLIKATIEASAREPIRKMLDDLGIDNVMLCPEPNAIASALREKYGAP